MKLYGQHVPVHAEVVDITELSSHADADELVAWAASATEPAPTTFVVHGEESASEALASRLAEEVGTLAIVPREGERVLL